MATTSKPIDILAVGIRDTSGNPVASGKARFYLPGTTTPGGVYSDALCTTPIISALVTLNAAGQGTAYLLDPMRMVVKDSAETTTYYDGIVNLVRHDSVYVTSPGFNSGSETTLETILAGSTTSFGAGFQAKATSTATARNLKDVIYEREVSIEDFGATANGVDAAAAIQAASDYIESLGGGVVLIPIGTFLITSPITIDHAGVSWRGLGRLSVIENNSTSGNAIVVNLGSAADSKLSLRDFAIKATSTSSGTGILVSNGDYVRIQNVSVSLHRTGIDASAVTGAQLKGCRIESTDDNAAAGGLVTGPRGRISDCEVVSGTTNGFGIVVAADSRVRDCYVTKFATGISLVGARSNGIGCHVTGATTGVSMAGAGSRFEDGYVVTATTGISQGANGCRATNNYIASCTAGIATGAYADCINVGNYGTSNTTDQTVASSATNFGEFNSFATYTNAGTNSWPFPLRLRVATTADATAAPSWTPVASNTTVQSLDCQYVIGSPAVTVVNASITNVNPDDLLFLQIGKSGVNNITSVTFGTLYRGGNGTALGSTVYNIISGHSAFWIFRFHAATSKYRLLFCTSIDAATDQVW